MSPIRTDVSRLELFSAQPVSHEAQGAARAEAFSDFSAFHGADASVRLGAGAASLDPAHAARSIVGFLADN